MSKQIRITTVDNPYDPFKEWTLWLTYDKVQGYHTPERLAKVAPISDELSDQEIYESVEDGINELIRFGAINKKGQIIEYKKVFK